MGSPGADDPFGFPPLKGFEASSAVLGDVEGDDDVVRDWPLLPGCVGVVHAAETRESDRCHRHGAGAGCGIGGFAQV